LAGLGLCGLFGGPRGRGLCVRGIYRAAYGLRAGASRSLLTAGPGLPLDHARDEPDGRIEFACAEFASQLQNRGVTPVFWGPAPPGILRQPLSLDYARDKPDPLLKGEGTRRKYLFVPLPRPDGGGYWRPRGLGWTTFRQREAR
jgi:hypothetical protein